MAIDVDSGDLGPASGGELPRHVVLILLDSLNRHMIGAYGGSEFDTPNLDSFAEQACRFDRHYAGSLPCIPARHDILTGAIDFLWRPWGSIEIWERSITWHLRRAGVVTKLVTDHPHLFEVGGENYHTDFTAWEYQRGHESDPWKTRPDPSWVGAPSFGRGHMPYDDSRGYFRSEEDFPGPRTMAAAARWIEEEAPDFGEDDRFFLFVDEFDPHEPFDTPDPYASMYDESWEGPHLIWPPYVKDGIERGVIDRAQARQIRASYGGKLTMIDKWFGLLVDAIQNKGLLSETAVIVTTDHGHYLGEKDIWGKPAVPLYEPISHIPLLIRWPGREAGQVDALTTSADLFATICEIFGIRVEHATHGNSLVPLIDESARDVREYVLAGVWGREVHLVTRGAKYARAPVGENEPLSLWSNRWSTMPVYGRPELELPLPDDRATLEKMPGSSVPVIRQPFRAGDLLPFWAYGRFEGHKLFDLEDDPDEEANRAGEGSGLEREMEANLRAALEEIGAPREQFERMGLA